MQSRIRKWGNGLWLRLPRRLALEAGLEVGSIVDLTAQSGRLIVRHRRSPGCGLKDLLKAVTSGNVHQFVETGEPAGR
jgi:antitoxin MazE